MNPRTKLPKVLGLDLNDSMDVKRLDALCALNEKYRVWRRWSTVRYWDGETTARVPRLVANIKRGKLLEEVKIENGPTYWVYSVPVPKSYVLIERCVIVEHLGSNSINAYLF